MTDAILKREEQAILTLRQLYRSYGYGPYKMSRFEEYDLYVRSKDFLVSDQIITFSGDRGKLMALKPDVTMSIVKNAPEEPGVIQKVYYNENVYRDYREIMQAGLECVGDLGAYEIAEVTLLAAKSLALLGTEFVLDISHMGLISAVLDSCGLEGEQRKQALDCLRRKNLQSLEQLCGENGEKLMALASCHGTGREVKELLTTPEEFRAWSELEDLLDLLEKAGFGGHVRLDFSVGNNMRYYNGVVFRGYLEGIPTSVLSGGQYDRLPRKLGRKAKAVGFAIYVDLLQELQKAEAEAIVDTLILHDGTVDAKSLSAAAEKAASEGTVLVTRNLPQDRSWKKLLRFEKGEAVTC